MWIEHASWLAVQAKFFETSSDDTTSLSHYPPPREKNLKIAESGPNPIAKRRQSREAPGILRLLLHCLIARGSQVFTR